jgi:hypothetical protein
MKIKLSETVEFKKLQEVVTETCTSIAFHTYAQSDCTYVDCKEVKRTEEERRDFISDSVENDVDVAFRAIELCFDNISCLTDTVTRRCAKSAIYDVIDEVITNNIKVGPSLEYIREHIDLESVWEDLLHMNTCEEDEYEYEGENHLLDDVE